MTKMDKFERHYNQYLDAIEQCVGDNLVLPSLTLIYSGIDAFAWLAYGDVAVRKRFTDWVKNYMYSQKELSPTPVDLYAARCAILHTLTPDSDLSRGKKARKIAYAWGTANVDDLETSRKITAQDDTVCVHLNDLIESFKQGSAYFLQRESKSAECCNRMKKHFAHLDMEAIQEFNARFA